MSRRDANNELVRRIQAGDRAAETELVEANMGFIINVARKVLVSIGMRGKSTDEYIGEAVMRFLRAARLFDVQRGFSFTSYAHPAIWNAVKRQAKSEIAQSIGDRQDVSPGFLASAVTWSSMPGDRMSYTEQCDLAVDALLDLPERHADVFESRARGESLRSIGDRLGISKERVRQIENRARLRMREYMETST